MSSAVRYQVMPPLSSEEYQELHDDIKVNGVLEPIHVDEEGVVIDGHHRSKIAAELNIPCPVITHDDLDDVGKRSLAFTLNLKRRHLNREQRRALIAESLKLDPLARDAEHAKRTGADRKTVKRIREEVQIPQPSEAIAEYVEQHPEKSNREVARDLGVSHVTVGAASGQKREFPENDHPSTKPVNADNLDALNAPLPTEQPTMEQTEDKPRAEPITNRFTSAVVDLNRVMAKFDRLANDPNFPRNKEKVAALHRHDLTRSISELQALADQLN